MPGTGRPAVFLDRDGTLIEDIGYLRNPNDVRLLPGAAEALRELEEQGFLLVVVTNQSGIGRGLLSPADAEAVGRRFLACLEQQGAHVHGVYVCPHVPTAQCACRKPAPGMLFQAASEHDVDLARSFSVGDKACDIEAGQRAGCSTILLSFCRAAPVPTASDYTARSWPEAVAWILATQRKRAGLG
jgi:D-glycero-D-manno-heptose 1,7-bisphosphate phosphatase